MAPQEEKQIWTLSNTIMAAMGGLILLLLTAGFWSINNKIDSGDSVIGTRLLELSSQIRSTNEGFQKLCQDVARIDTYQKIRLEREAREKK